MPAMNKSNYTNTQVDKERSRLIFEDDDDSGLAMAEDLNRAPDVRMSMQSDQPNNMETFQKPSKF